METTKVQGSSTEEGKRFPCKISFTYLGLAQGLSREGGRQAVT